jgi:hypothetical protein
MNSADQPAQRWLRTSENRFPKISENTEEARRFLRGTVGAASARPRLKAFQPSLLSAVLINSKQKGSTNQFGWLQASATKNYSAPVSYEYPATIRIDKGASRAHVGHGRDPAFVV